MKRLRWRIRSRSEEAPRDDRRPILAVDIDGVLSLFGFAEPPNLPGVEFHLVDGVMHCFSRAAGKGIMRLADHYDVVWVSGWEGGAEKLAEVLDLPEWPYLTFGGAARFGSADWKLEPLERYAQGRPLAWIDDSFDERCYAWARARPEPTLLIEIESDQGLQEVHVEAIVAWARSLATDGVAANES